MFSQAKLRAAQRIWDNMTPEDFEGPEPEPPEEHFHVVESTIHKANKDHYDRKGKLLVHKGQLYKRTVVRYWTEYDEDGNWGGRRWWNIHKTPLDQVDWAHCVPLSKRP